ncbi:MAG TPA: inorganic triphosphatase, partial [Pseudomonas oleovorans]|nr:inorganic triphosphatase [Pseudomonas oleovorans]
RPRLAAGQNDDSMRRNAPALFAAELDGCRWGLLSLKLSYWLLQRSWTAARNARGERQGKAALGSWLPTLLAEEGAALQLRRYQQQPEDLAEQMPRLERLLVWLRLARGVLDVAEVDRLYGELSKLQGLALQPLDDEQRQLRMTQTQVVQSLKAWKALVK